MTLTTEQSPEMTAYGRVVGGRYQVLETLGAGGMAVVYNAYDSHLERNVALKMILPSQQSSALFLERFQVEARSLAQLSHGSIVKVLDYGEDDGVPFLVMEFITGGTLKELTGRPISYEQAAAILAPVARALDYVHQHSIVHRDVKPSNILLTDKDAPMLSDFGVVRLLEEESLEAETLATGVGIGTPDYMSPEQGMGRPTDFRADIYSLGVVFFELTTGQKPFTAETPMAVVIQHVTGEFPRPQLLGVRLPPLVEAVIRRAVAKDPSDRFEDMGRFAAALEEIARGEKMSERTLRRLLKPHPTPAQQAQQRVARRVALALAVLVALFILGGVVWWGGWSPRLAAAFNDGKALSFYIQPTASATVAAKATIKATASKPAAKAEKPSFMPTRTPAVQPSSTAKPSPTLGLVSTSTPKPTTPLSSQDVFFDQPVALIDHPLPASGETFGDVSLLGVWGIGAVQQLLYDQSGERVFQATSQGVFVYSVKNLARLHFIPTRSWVEVIALTPDGETLYVGLRSGDILLYDAETYQAGISIPYHAPSSERLAGLPAAPVQTIGFSNDSKYLALGYHNGTLRLFELDGMRQVFIWDQYKSVSGFYFSDDNRYLYSAKDDAEINVWDLSTGKVDHVIKFSSPVSFLRVSPDGQWLWSAGAGGVITVINLQNDLPLYSYDSQRKAITGLTISADAKTFAVGLKSGEIVLYPYPTGEDLHKKQIPFARLAAHPDALTSLTFSPDGKALISASYREGLLLWDTTGKQTGSLGQNRPAIKRMAFTANNQWLLVEHIDHKVDIWLVAESRLLATFDGVIPDGDIFLQNQYVMLAKEGQNLWDEGQFLLIHYPDATLARSLPGYKRGWMVSPNPDEKLLVAGTPQKAIIWDTATWERLDFHDGINSGCGQFFTPENNLITILWEKGVLFELNKQINNLCVLKPDFAQVVALNPHGTSALYKLNRDGRLWQWSLDEKVFTDQQNFKTYEVQSWPDERFLSYAPDGNGYLWVKDDEWVMAQSTQLTLKIGDWAAFQYQGALSSEGTQRLVALGSQFGTITIYGK